MSYSKNEAKDRYILCSAIHFDDDKKYYNQPTRITSGFVVVGRRHMDILNITDILGVNKDIFNENNMVYGFITNDNIFVNRKMGLQIAKYSGQVSKDLNVRELLSEHLY